MDPCKEPLKEPLKGTVLEPEKDVPRTFPELKAFDEEQQQSPS